MLRAIRTRRASIMRPPFRQGTPVGLLHPANPAHLPGPSTPAPCAYSAGMPAGLPHVRQDAGSWRHCLEIRLIASLRRGGDEARNLNRSLTDLNAAGNLRGCGRWLRTVSFPSCDTWKRPGRRPAFRGTIRPAVSLDHASGADPPCHVGSTPCGMAVLALARFERWGRPRSERITATSPLSSGLFSAFRHPVERQTHRSSRKLRHERSVASIYKRLRLSSDSLRSQISPVQCPLPLSPARPSRSAQVGNCLAKGVRWRA